MQYLDFIEVTVFFDQLCQPLPGFGVFEPRDYTPLRHQTRLRVQISTYAKCAGIYYAQ